MHFFHNLCTITKRKKMCFMMHSIICSYKNVWGVFYDVEMDIENTIDKYVYLPLKEGVKKYFLGKKSCASYSTVFPF